MRKRLLAPSEEIRVVLVGDYSGREDEGLRVISARMCDSLSALAQVLAVSTGDALKPGTMREIARFRPHVVHHLCGPTRRGWLVLAALRHLTPGRPRTVISATRPFLGQIDRAFARLFKPDLILTQAPRWESFFLALGIECQFVSNGTDRTRFHPPSRAERDSARSDFRVVGDRPLVLHVGHIRRNRGLECFRGLPSLGYDCLIIGSPSLSDDRELAARLEASGVRLICDFLPEIERAYWAADCYAFFLQDLPPGAFPKSYNQIGVIDTPLSVLEAVATGLPVVTTPYGGLRRVLGDSEQVLYIEVDECDSASDLIERAVRPGVMETRSSAMSWDAVGTRILSAYRRVCLGRSFARTT